EIVERPSSAGGMFVLLLTAYYLLTRDVLPDFSEGRTPNGQLVSFALRLRDEALGWGWMADEILGGRNGCQHDGCQHDEPRHQLYLHPAPLVAYRIAASAMVVVQLANDGGDFETARAVGRDDLVDLFDDPEMLSFLRTQVREERYAKALPDIYDWLG